MKRQGKDAVMPSAIEALDLEPLANLNAKAPLICLPCHYTCATCSGPHSNQCLSCLDDAQLFNITDMEPKYYCYPNTLLPQISDANWHYKLNVILIVILFILSFLSLYLIFVCLLKRFGYRCCSNHYNSNIAYNKLAVDEKDHSALEIEEEIHKAIHKYSSDESDDDLNL